MKNITRSSTLKLVRITAITVVALIIVIYAGWRSRDFVRGPELIIDEPTDGQTFSDTTILVRGQAKRANSLILNGNTITIDEDGFWQETIIIYPGINKISVEASDRFGKKTSDILTILGTRQLTPVPERSQISPVSTSTIEIDSASSTAPL